MVGIVLMGLVKANFEFQFHYSLLINQIKNVNNSHNSILSLIENLINFPILLVILASIIFILIYLLYSALNNCLFLKKFAIFQ